MEVQERHCNTRLNTAYTGLKQTPMGDSCTAGSCSQETLNLDQGSKALQKALQKCHNDHRLHVGKLSCKHGCNVVRLGSISYVVFLFLL